MTVFKRLSILALFLLTVTDWGVCNAWGAPTEQTPHVGYLYPAGGQRGGTVRITAAGQFLRGVKNVYLSGKGVHATLVEYVKPLNGMELNDIRKYVADLLKKDEKPAPAAKPAKPVDVKAAKPTDAKAAQPADAAKTETLTLPDHPLARKIEKMSLPELKSAVAEFRDLYKKKQMNQQLAEQVIIDVAIDADAPPGARELRLDAPLGLTNPLRFDVGTLPEVSEQASFFINTGTTPRAESAETAPVLDTPVVLNGQIMPGAVDHYRIRARRGQRLVVDACARGLMPYLADAVPGWFQAAVTLRDAKGTELASADHYEFNPDPVIFYQVPDDGEYQLEIRDSIYRGREDFVYRVTVGAQPFVTALFPLGGKTGTKEVAKVAGWNLPDTRAKLDTAPGPDLIRQTVACKSPAQIELGTEWGGCLHYAVNTLPERKERESNDVPKKAQKIKLPVIINGRIDKPGDVDVFRFKGRANDQVVAEVYARRLGSPLDSLLKLADASGHVLAWNDDTEDKGAGLLTHQADSYLCAKLPADGLYYVSLSDAEHHGGNEYAYRLRVSAPQPDFALRVTPSSVNAHPGGDVLLWVYAIRKDGFDGEIELALKDAPAGFQLSGGRVPKGCDSVRITLRSPAKPLDQPVALQLEGQATIDDKIVSHPAVPAEDMMQAFAYRHLVPCCEMLVASAGRRGALVEIAGNVPIRIPAGGAAQVKVNTPKRRPILKNVQLELSDPPKGLTLQNVTATPDGLTFTLEAKAGALKPGMADNLIVEAYNAQPPPPKNPKAAKQQNQRAFLGILPAIPFEIVQK